MTDRHEKSLEGVKVLQNELARKIRLVPLEKEPQLVAGVDVAYDLPAQVSWGAVVLMRLSDLQIVEEQVAPRPTPFPYVPGFLSFREIPVLKEALARLSKPPEVILVDGQGVLHPRRLGLAAHLGLEVGLPTIGVAKKPLIGRFEGIPEEPGQWHPILVEDEVRGVVLRSRQGVKPIYVSPGHLITLEESLALVKRCLTGYRLPEPLRLAHLLSQRARKSADL